MADDKEKQSGFLVCKGAKLTCTNAATPTPAILNVLSQMKYYINDPTGQEKLIASTDEKDLMAINFGSCKPSPNTTKPCMPQLVWDKVYPYVELKGGAKILLHNSTAECSKCKGSKITIIHHGQEMPMTVNHLNNIIADIASLNPLFPFVYVQQKKEVDPTKKPSVAYIETKIDGNDVQSNEKGKKTVYHIQVKKGVQNFKAYFNEKQGGDKDFTNWIINKNKREKYKEFINWGEELKNLVFHETGEYTVEAYGKTPNDAKCQLNFCVEENSLKEIQIKPIIGDVAKPDKKTKTISLGKGSITVTAVFKYEADRHDYKGFEWEILKMAGEDTNPESHFIFNFVNKIVSVNFFTENFFNYGVYDILLKKEGTIISNQSLEIIPDTPENLRIAGDRKIFRPGEYIYATVERKHNSVFFNTDFHKFVWEIWNSSTLLYNSGLETSTTNDGHAKSTFDKQIRFFIRYKGTYKLKVGIDKYLFGFNYKTKVLDEQKIQISENYPIEINLIDGGTKISDEYYAFKGETVKFEVDKYLIMEAWEDEKNTWLTRLMINSQMDKIEENEKSRVTEDKVGFGMDKNKAKETWQNEKDKVKWVVYNDKSVKCLDGNGNNFSACFTKEGTYKIQAYCDNSPEKIKPTKVIKIGIPKFEDAFWIFTSGDKTGEAGLNQEIGCIVEAKAFAGRKCKIVFWGGDICTRKSKIPKFNPEEYENYMEIETQEKTFDNNGSLEVVFNLSYEKRNQTKWDLEEYYEIHEETNIYIPVCFTIYFEDEIQDVQSDTALQVFRISYHEHYYIGNNKLCLKTKPQVIYISFRDVETGKFQITPVQVGKSVSLVAQTINMNGETFVFELYLNLEDEDKTKIKAIATGEKAYKVTVDEQGIAEQRITISDEWLDGQTEQTVYAKFYVENDKGTKYTPEVKHNCEPERVTILITKEPQLTSSTLCEGLAVIQLTEHYLRKKCFRCGKEHIDLRDKDKWISQFDPEFGTTAEQQTSCYRASRYILYTYYGLSENTSPNDSTKLLIAEEIKTVAEEAQTDSSQYLKINQTVAKAGICYIDEQLEAGYPVLVGVDHTFDKKLYNSKIKEYYDVNDDKTTDHWIVIVGRGCEDNKAYYRFYEVGTESKDNGTSDKNKLYLHTDFSLRGIPAHNPSRNYVVTQIRKNKLP